MTVMLVILWVFALLRCALGWWWWYDVHKLIFLRHVRCMGVRLGMGWSMKIDPPRTLIQFNETFIPMNVQERKAKKRVGSLVQRLRYLAVFAERRSDRRLAEVTDWTASVKYWGAVPKCTWCMSRRSLYWILYTTGSYSATVSEPALRGHVGLDWVRVEQLHSALAEVAWAWWEAGQLKQSYSSRRVTW